MYLFESGAMYKTNIDGIGIGIGDGNVIGTLIIGTIMPNGEEITEITLNF
jgi:hypothetical protein